MTKVTLTTPLIIVLDTFLEFVHESTIARSPELPDKVLTSKYWSWKPVIGREFQEFARKYVNL